MSGAGATWSRPIKPRADTALTWPGRREQHQKVAAAKQVPAVQQCKRKAVT